MVTETQMNHYERINHVKRYIREHMDEPLNRNELAQIAGYSIAHFHRIFTAHVGENISAYVRRVRMERAACQLLVADLNVIEIAFRSGYESHSAFGKAFKKQFCISPTEFRELNHTAAAHLINRHILYNRKEPIMQPKEIRTLPDTQVLYARASELLNGPAFQTANVQSFNRLMGFVGANNLMEHVRQVVAIYPDEPEEGKVVRIDAGVILAEGITPDATGGLDYQMLPGGRWAIFHHVGPYDTLWQTWHAAYRDWLPTSGCELRDALCFEDYLNDPSSVSPEALQTDIYIPIQ